MNHQGGRDRRFPSDLTHRGGFEAAATEHVDGGIPDPGGGEA